VHNITSESRSPLLEEDVVWVGQYDKLYIGGRWETPLGHDRISVVSPFSEQVIASVVCAGRADVDRAVILAREAFDHGPWPHMPVEERLRAISRLREGFVARHEQMAQLITDEMGSPITQARNIQARMPVLMLDAFMEAARNYPLRQLRRSETGNGYLVREPKGVVAAIVPWNVPMMTTIMKLGPALLMGCCVILKPAPETPLSAYMLGEMLTEAGIPEGVVSILPADRDVSEYLALHPGVDKVSFTGSSLAGRRLAAKCGELIRSITLELGGKSAAIFLEDADIETAVEALRLGSFRNSGQICTLKTRIIVPRKRRDAVADALGALIDSMPVGAPDDPATQIGPMVTRRQMERVSGYIEAGVRDGARAVRGGSGRPEGLNHGWFVRPTLFVDVDPDSTIAQEEIFGPVLAVSTFGSEEEAVEIANNSVYGLNGAVFSADVEKAVQIAARIKTGTVEINGGGVGFSLPYGGVKQSGLGREGGVEGLETYTEIKTIGLPKAYAQGLLS
jgi:betaine-aldehyde dehydrogenase